VRTGSRIATERASARRLGRDQKAGFRDDNANSTLMSGNGTDLEVGPGSGAGVPGSFRIVDYTGVSPSMSTRAFLGTHPADEAITSELPVIRP
jgi:hypothetical protein